jgi:hypothetical protein
MPTLAEECTLRTWDESTKEDDIEVRVLVVLRAPATVGGRAVSFWSRSGNGRGRTKFDGADATRAATRWRIEEAMIDFSTLNGSKILFEAAACTGDNNPRDDGLRGINGSNNDGTGVRNREWRWDDEGGEGSAFENEADEVDDNVKDKHCDSIVVFLRWLLFRKARGEDRCWWLRGGFGGGGEGL